MCKKESICKVVKVLTTADERDWYVLNNEKAFKDIGKEMGVCLEYRSIKDARKIFVLKDKGKNQVILEYNISAKQSGYIVGKENKPPLKKYDSDCTKLMDYFGNMNLKEIRKVLKKSVLTDGVNVVDCELKPEVYEEVEDYVGEIHRLTEGTDITKLEYKAVLKNSKLYQFSKKELLEIATQYKVAYFKTLNKEMLIRQIL